MTRTERIHSILTEHFQPIHLEVVDQSHLHAGHAGARPEGHTHYAVLIRSSHFAGMGKVQMHQAIYRVLGEEFAQGLHALAIDASAGV